VVEEVFLFLEVTMKKIQALALVTCIGLASCAPANIFSAKWDSDVSASDAQTRCEQVDMRNKAEMDAVFSKYDGWKLIYVSEYTTQHRIGTDGTACFEREKKP
jgi:hypothetical protein